MYRSIRRSLLGLATTATLAFPAQAQILETETARPLGRHGVEVAGNLEYQTSSEGHEVAVPFAMEYGLTDRLELLVEPVAYTAIRPAGGGGATGGGDLEVTTTYLARRETRGLPAVAIAGEIKLPTTGNRLIGTGYTDFAAYLIGSKRFGRLDTHANIGYAVLGHAAGAPLKNIFNFAFGWERSFGRTNELFGELLANTAAASAPEPTSGTGPTAVTPEAPGGELVATLGVARYVVSSLRLVVGLSVDNNGAVLVRPGFTLGRGRPALRRLPLGDSSL